MSENEDDGGGGIGWVEVAGLVLVVGLVAVVLAPSFFTHRHSHRLSEVKANLKALYTAEKAWFAERDEYLEDGARIGWDPEAGNRYAYSLGKGPCWMRPGTAPSAFSCVTNDTARFPGLLVAPVRPASIPFDVGVSGSCPDCQFAASAIGNRDADAQLDEWFISSADGAVVGGGGPCDPEVGPSRAGIPFNSRNDVSCD